MKRLLAALAAGLVCLTLAQLPATAAPITLTIVTERTVIPEDTSFAITGKAKNAKTGTVVQLQRRTSGSWVKVASRKITSTKLYTFKRTEPAVGTAKYRVHMKAQLGQPATSSVVLKLTVKKAMILSAPASRNGALYEVNVTLTAGPLLGNAHLQALTAPPNGWSDIDTEVLAPSFVLSVDYPQEPGKVRLVIDGDEEYAEHIAPLPNAGVLHHPMTLGVGLEINENLLGGHFRSFDFVAEEGEFYSIHEASRNPQPAPGAWIPTGLILNDFAPTFSYFEASVDGPASLLHRPDLDTAVLAGPVTVWRRKEATVSAPKTPVQRSVGAGQWINYKLPITCTSPSLAFSFHSSDVTQSSTVYLDPPSGDDQETTLSFNGTSEHIVDCAAGTWSIHILRSNLTAGNISLAYAPVVTAARTN